MAASTTRPLLKCCAAIIASRSARAPGSAVAVSASARTLGLYSAVKVRRLALATTSASGRAGASGWEAPVLPAAALRSASLRSASLRFAAAGKTGGEAVEAEDIPLFFTWIPILALLSNYDQEICLIHVGTEGIGGEDDTNQNTTRRLLLLLESRAVGREDAYHRVVRSILNRYLLEDRGLWRGSGHRVPRFLQNDFARYWRTMAVDFAYKLRKRAGKGWTIRNIKLRMSRKLIYVSGLLACYRCHLDYSPQDRKGISGDPDRHKEVVEHMEAVFRETPLDIVAGVLLRYAHLDEAARKIFGAYDGFLGILADDQSRGHLERLTEDLADKDETYQRARQFSHSFRDGLLAFFFDPESELDDMTKNYGVF
jgi:hypothetical protein